MKRIHIVGTSGSGKTTLARALAVRLSLPHIELDAIRHGPNWIDLPDPEFQERVREALSGEGWVVEGNYGVVRDLIGERADTVVWLDYNRGVVFQRVFWRTLRRCVTREELWNGNLETFRNSFFARDGVVLWAMKTHARRRRTFGQSLPEWEAAREGRRLVHLRAPRDTRCWLAQSQL